MQAETQTLVWFAVTIIGVAVLSGHFARWQRVDQVAGALVAAGAAWLLVRTGG